MENRAAALPSVAYLEANSRRLPADTLSALAPLSLATDAMQRFAVADAVRGSNPTRGPDGHARCAAAR
jgi:hypothetical protein